MDFQRVRKAERARDDFLKEHPELISFQEKIDKQLASAGSAENRMALLYVLMDEQRYALSQTCREGQKILQRYFPKPVCPQEDKNGETSN